MVLHICNPTLRRLKQENYEFEANPGCWRGGSTGKSSLPGDPGSVPSTHAMAHNCPELQFQGDLGPSSGSPSTLEHKYG